MGRVVTGRVYIRVNGEVILNKPGAKATGIGGYKKTPVMGDSGIHGYAEEATPSTCEFTMTDTNEKSLAAMANDEEVTVQFEAANNGKMYILNDAICEGGFELTAGEGEVPVVYFGDRWDEQLA